MKTQKVEEIDPPKGMLTILFSSIPGSIVLGSLFISFSILLIGGVIKIDGITPLGLTAGEKQVAPAQPNNKVPQQAPVANTGPVKVSLDDDPVLGNKNAPITLVEFSDYECPFCKRHFDQTYSELKRDYIDTGKVKLVFRDLPLSFHDPMATTEAIAANCAREQGGDTAYFKFHDEMFKRTTSNGNGLNKDKIYQIAADNGLNETNFKVCLDSEKFKDEVSKDLADASSYGASGTPTFFIGKSSGIEIEGTKLVGAQPYSAFKTIIDQQLK